MKIRFNDAKPAIGVEFAEKKGRPVHFVGAKKEFILYAGAIKTPHILLFFGIGPASELSKHSIPVDQHLPCVGQTTQSHAFFKLLLPN